MNDQSIDEPRKIVDFAGDKQAAALKDRNLGLRGIVLIIPLRLKLATDAIRRRLRGELLA